MTYGAVLIVRNEEASIGRCLASAVAAGVSPITVVDTGSTDRTMEIAASFDRVVLHERTWRDFGHNRSEAFALARGTADWIIALDADFTVEIDPDFEPDPALDAYLLKMTLGQWDYRLPLLLQGDLPWVSRGAVHEYTALPDRDYVSAPTDQVRITNHGQQNSSFDRSRWHAQMLEAELAEQPDNARTVFYLAQTYRDLGETEKARRLYGRRLDMVGFEEEAFESAYALAQMTAEWPARLAALLAAWNRRPWRLEPLHDAVRGLNELGQHQVAYTLARWSRWRPEMPDDRLFLHRDVWAWGLDFERSIAEWWAGDRAEARRQMDDLLTRDLPDYIRARVEANRAF